MNRSYSIAVASTATPEKNLARRYQQIQRLRQLVQEAERFITLHNVDIALPDPSPNLQGRHQV